MSKKKKYLILLISMLTLAAITAGIYLFINPKVNSSTLYSVDKYSDVTNWCDTSIKDNTLSIDCKALLINIDANSCFEVQVITKDKELRDLNVCESDDILTYTNDILGYKNLMPVDVVFTYTKSGILENYSFSNVSFLKMEDTYVQSVVNEDIANLVTIDSKTTTIQNSINFCPRLELLPEYVTEENKKTYDIFYSTSKLDQSFFSDGSLYNTPINELKLIFGCESQITSGYKDLCTTKNINITSNLEQALLQMPKNINFAQGFGEFDISTLHNISIIYDGEEFTRFSDESGILENMIKSLSLSDTTNQETYCSTYKLLKSFGNDNKTLKSYISYMENYINENLKDMRSGLCLEAIEKTKIDMTGYYLKNYIGNRNNHDQLSILNNCINLNSIIK